MQSEQEIATICRGLHERILALEKKALEGAGGGKGPASQFSSSLGAGPPSTSKSAAP